MKKKSNTARLGALALALTMVTTCLTGGTMAKYVTTVSATGSATVAKFDVDIKGNGTEFGSEIKDLFTSGWKAPVGNGVEENMLAPGVYGYFDIVVENKSEVMVKISDVKITPANNGKIRMKFALTEVTADDKPVSFDIESEDNLQSKIVEGLKGNIGWQDSDKSKKVRVWWTWDVGESDEADKADTAIGSYGSDAPTYGLTISITAEQVVSTPTP
nr:hypothetical protein [uncultured Eisenbergiella sp.]